MIIVEYPPKPIMICANAMTGIDLVYAPKMRTIWINSKFTHDASICNSPWKKETEFSSFSVTEHVHNEESHNRANIKCGLYEVSVSLIVTYEIGMCSDGKVVYWIMSIFTDFAFITTVTGIGFGQLLIWKGTFENGIHKDKCRTQQHPCNFYIH